MRWFWVVGLGVLNVYNIATADSFSAWCGWMASGIFFVGLSVTHWQLTKLRHEAKHL